MGDSIDRVQVLADIRAAKIAHPAQVHGTTESKIINVLTIAQEEDESPLSSRQLAAVIDKSIKTIAACCTRLVEDGKIVGERLYSNTAWLWSLPIVTDSVTNDDLCNKT